MNKPGKCFIVLLFCIGISMPVWSSTTCDSVKDIDFRKLDVDTERVAICNSILKLSQPCIDSACIQLLNLIKSDTVSGLAKATAAYLLAQFDYAPAIPEMIKHMHDAPLIPDELTMFDKPIMACEYAGALMYIPAAKEPLIAHLNECHDYYELWITSIVVWSNTGWKKKQVKKCLKKQSRRAPEHLKEGYKTLIKSIDNWTETT